MLPKSFDKRARSEDDHTPRPDISLPKKNWTTSDSVWNNRQRAYYICIASNNLLIDDWRLLFLLSQVMERAIFHSDNCYLIPNIRVRGYVCKTNIPSNTAFRGFGGPQVCMACACLLPRRWKASFPNADSDWCPLFYVKRSDFWKMDIVLKVKVNFPSLNLETWPFSCPKNSKAQGMVLKWLKSKTLLRGNMSLEPPQ